MVIDLGSRRRQMVMLVSLSLDIGSWGVLGLWS